MGSKQVVILSGAGFGGLAAAKLSGNPGQRSF